MANVAKSVEKMKITLLGKKRKGTDEKEVKLDKSKLATVPECLQEHPSVLDVIADYVSDEVVDVEAIDVVYDDLTWAIHCQQMFKELGDMSEGASQAVHYGWAEHYRKHAAELRQYVKN